MTTRTVGHTPGSKMLSLSGLKVLRGEEEIALAFDRGGHCHVEIVGEMVRRHNCHDDLVAALQECEAYLWGIKQELGGTRAWRKGDPVDVLYENIKAALAKAEPKRE